MLSDNRLQPCAMLTLAVRTARSTRHSMTSTIGVSIASVQWMTGTVTDASASAVMSPPVAAQEERRVPAARGDAANGRERERAPAAPGNPEGRNIRRRAG